MCLHPVGNTERDGSGVSIGVCIGSGRRAGGRRPQAGVNTPMVISEEVGKEGDQPEFDTRARVS